MLQPRSNLIDFTGHRPIHPLNLSTCLQIYNTMAEQVEALFTDLLCIMPRFQHPALVQVIPNIIQFVHQFVIVWAYLKFFVHRRKRSRFKHLEYQHRMMCRERASAFSNDVRMRNTILVTRIHHNRYGIIHILLNGIIHAAFTIRRACTIVVHTQTASNVDKLYGESHPVELYIKLRSLTQCSLDTTYLSHLTSDMEMNQLQAILHFLFFDKIECLKQFTGSQPELAGISPTFFPFSTSRRSQLDTYTDIGTYIELLCHFGYEAKLVQLLHYQENALSHLLCQQSQFDVTLVFVSVTNNQRIGVSIDGYHGMQFGFRTCFQSQIELLAVADDFFYHGTHLVHLNGINDEVLCIVAIFLRCLSETIRNFFDTVIQNIRETHQHRCCDVPELQFIHQFFQVDCNTVFSGSHFYVTFVINPKIGNTPPRNVVEFF
ncbi:uncharacterized protein BN759_01686 [Bacteroides sp. CAG:702]|nr:uncharacterized protein BN759_01686 [Bacteroides sp. CAG:702]